MQVHVCLLHQSIRNPLQGLLRIFFLSIQISPSKNYSEMSNNNNNNGEKIKMFHLNEDTSWLLSLDLGGTIPLSSTSKATSAPKKFEPSTGGAVNATADSLKGLKLNGESSSSGEEGLKKQEEKLVSSIQSGRNFNLLIDPWFSGLQVDVLASFSTQHPSKTCVSCIADIPKTLPGIEKIDAILISFEFTDHCHKETLIGEGGAPKSTPIFCTRDAAVLVKSWGYFENVYTITQTRQSLYEMTLSSVAGIPSDLFVHYVPGLGVKSYYHGAILIHYQPSSSTTTHDSLICYQPHGTSNPLLPSLLNKILAVTPSTPPESEKERRKTKLTVITPLDGLKLPLFGDILLGPEALVAQISLLREDSKPSAILITHQVEKKGEGLVGRNLERFKVNAEDLRVELWLEGGSNCRLQEIKEGTGVSV